MHRVTVDIPTAPSTSYPIDIGPGGLGRLAEYCEGATGVAVVSDERVWSHWGETVSTSLTAHDPAVVRIPAGETHKTLATLEAVWAKFEAAGLDRHAVVINVGGGVVGDLGGFAAASFLRGIRFVQAPTTLLAMVDASVGGKVGVDFERGKNRIGAFAQPQAVVIDPTTLSTLDSREYRAGFAEVLKHGFIADRAYLDSIDPQLANDPSAPGLVDLIRRSCEIKAEVVGSDERELGRRKILNFGHTAGHALESIALAKESTLLHGEAVAIGMAIETHLSARLGLVSDDVVTTVEAAIERCGLAVRIPGGMSVDAIVDWVHTDKKKRGGDIGWSLLADLGGAVFDQKVPEPVLRSTLVACGAQDESRP